MNNPFDVIETRLSNIESLLLDLKHNHNEQNNSDTDLLLTVQDTAKFLSLSVPTIYGLISKGDLPVLKRAKRCYFTKADLINYLKEGRKQPAGEIEPTDFLINKSK